MLVIMVSRNAWNEMWVLLSAQPSLAVTEDTILEHASSVSTVGTAKKCINLLRAFGLISSTSGKLTQLGKRWANKDTYPAVCKELIRKQYPAGAEPALSRGDLTRTEKAQWLMEHAGMKQAGAEKNVTFFSILSEGAEGTLPHLEDTDAAKLNAPVDSEDERSDPRSVTVTISSQIPPEEMASILTVLSSSITKSDLTISFTV